jgi:hypothetical protein
VDGVLHMASVGRRLEIIIAGDINKNREISNGLIGDLELGCQARICIVVINILVTTRTTTCLAPYRNGQVISRRPAWPVDNVLD